MGSRLRDRRSGSGTRTASGPTAAYLGHDAAAVSTRPSTYAADRAGVLRRHPQAPRRALGVHRGARRQEVLDRVLGAAHSAPSVGLSQPWDFVLVADPPPPADFWEHVQSERAGSPTRCRETAERFAGIKIDGVLEASLSVVVTYDPARGAPAGARSPRHRRCRPVLGVPGHREHVAGLHGRGLGHGLGLVLPGVLSAPAARHTRRRSDRWHGCASDRSATSRTYPTSSATVGERGSPRVRRPSRPLGTTDGRTCAPRTVQKGDPPAVRVAWGMTDGRLRAPTADALSPRRRRRRHRLTLAIDIGGTGLKASVLDANGAMVADRVREPTTYPLSSVRSSWTTRGRWWRPCLPMTGSRRDSPAWSRRARAVGPALRHRAGPGHGDRREPGQGVDRLRPGRSTRPPASTSRPRWPTTPTSKGPPWWPARDSSSSSPSAPGLGPALFYDGCCSRISSSPTTRSARATPTTSNWASRPARTSATSAGTGGCAWPSTPCGRFVLRPLLHRRRQRQAHHRRARRRRRPRGQHRRDPRRDQALGDGPHRGERHPRRSVLTSLGYRLTTAAAPGQYRRIPAQSCQRRQRRSTSFNSLRQPFRIPAAAASSKADS